MSLDSTARRGKGPAKKDESSDRERRDKGHDRMPGKTPLIARKAKDGNGVGAGAEGLVSAAGGSAGSALPGTLQRRFEGSLGVDLDGVRVHTGAESAAAADSVSARAYTVGRDIHFGAGQYDPSSGQGQHLIAHEVAHTVQQSGGASRKAQFKLDVSAPGDAHEVEADRAADAMVAGRPAQVGTATGVARKVMRDASPARESKAGMEGLGAEVVYKPTYQFPQKIQIPDTPFQVSVGVLAEFHVRAKTDVGPDATVQVGGATQTTGATQGSPRKTKPEAEAEVSTELGRVSQVEIEGGAVGGWTKEGGILGGFVSFSAKKDGVKAAFKPEVQLEWEDGVPKVSLAQTSVSLPLQHKGTLFDSNHVECDYRMGPVTLQATLGADGKSLLQWLIQIGADLGVEGALAMLADCAVIFAPAVMAACAIYASSEEQQTLNVISSEALQARKSVGIFMSWMDPRPDVPKPDPGTAGAYGAAAKAKALEKLSQIYAVTKMDAATLGEALRKDQRWSDAVVAMTENLEKQLWRALEIKAREAGQNFLQQHKFISMWDELWKDPGSADFSGRCVQQVDEVFCSGHGGVISESELGPPTSVNIP